MFNILNRAECLSSPRDSTPFSYSSYSSSEKPRAQESFLKIKTLDLEVSKTLERGRAKN